MNTFDRAKIYAKDLQAKIGDKNRRKICVFIGAGASLMSGGISFDTLKSEMAQMFKTNIDKEHVEENIEEYFNKLLGAIKDDRRPTFIKDFLNLDGSPSDGYIYTVILTKLGIIDFVLSTNFDFFLEKASKEVCGENIYDVYLPHFLKDDISLDDFRDQKPPFIKIHGDCSNGIYYITEEELNEGTYPENIKRIIQEVFKTHDIIFIGYGGHEKKLGKTLVPIKKDLNDIYWFNPQKAKDAKVLGPIIEGNLVYDNLPSPNTNLYFDNVLKEIALLVLENSDFVMDSLKAKYLTYELLKVQVRKWNDINANLSALDAKERLKIKDIFVNRKNIESKISHFLSEDEYLLVLAGKSGFGKSTLLKYLCRTYNDSNHLLSILIPLKIIPNTGLSFERTLAEKLGLKKFDLELLNVELSKKKKKIVIILDGLNEFSHEYQDCENYYKEIYTFAYKLYSKNISGIKLIVSCRTETWLQIQEQLGEYQKEPIYDNQGKALQINQFDEFELRLAYSKYQSAYDVKTAYDELLPLAKERLMDPFMLKLTCAAQGGGKIIFEAPSIEVYYNFFRKKFRFISGNSSVNPIISLKKFAQKCLDLSCRSVPISEFSPDQSNNDLRHFVDLNILERYEDKFEEYYSFAHDRFFEFFLAKAISNKPLNSRADLDTFFQDVKSFPYLYGALRFLVITKERTDLFILILDSDNKDIQSFAKDILFEISQLNPDFFRLVFFEYIKNNAQINGIRILLQAASLNPDLMDVSHNLMAFEDAKIQSEASYFFIKNCAGYIQKNELTKETISELLKIQQTKSNWLKIGSVFTLLSQLSWDNFQGSIESYYEVVRSILLDILSQISKADIEKFVNMNLDDLINKYLFNANNITGFFDRTEEEIGAFQEFIDLISTKGKLSDRDSSTLETYAKSNYKLERTIGKLVFILLGKRDRVGLNKYLKSMMVSAGDPKQWNTATSLTAYVSIANSEIELDFIHEMNAYHLSNNPDFLAFDKGYEKLFNPIGTYGFIYPIVQCGCKIDLFSEYIKKFIENKEGGLLLRILHALRQSISLFPKEGLKTIEPLVFYSGSAEVRSRLIQILSESYARNPEITNLFIAKNEIAFTKNEIYEIKFGLDPKIHSHAITILEWSRVYHFLISSENSYSYFNNILTKVNQSKDLYHALIDVIGCISPPNGVKGKV